MRQAPPLPAWNKPECCCGRPTINQALLARYGHQGDIFGDALWWLQLMLRNHHQTYQTVEESAWLLAVMALVEAVAW